MSHDVPVISYSLTEFGGVGTATQDGWHVTWLWVDAVSLDAFCDMVLWLVEASCLALFTNGWHGLLSPRAGCLAILVFIMVSFHIRGITRSPHRNRPFSKALLSNTLDPGTTQSLNTTTPKLQHKNQEKIMGISLVRRPQAATSEHVQKQVTFLCWCSDGE
jgi:hypothetical protein